ncbi:unnamed protein product [Brassicogethes aeneus]|uniref:RRM domain-containing protein n=1 Tax=Brassicogethes aeneus TaxID=1431903 RepID=A0A9P0AX99_BRAAE|nr:unnamed protein product [Brassicogethes aeneus]
MVRLDPEKYTLKEYNSMDFYSVRIDNINILPSVKTLSDYFRQCGVIERVYVHSKITDGFLKRFAHITFKDKYSVVLALRLNKTLFNDQIISVKRKRTKRFFFKNQFCFSNFDLLKRKVYM